MTLINPEAVAITLPDGTTKEYILSDFPATLGREIIAKYPTSNAPKIGSYDVSEATMLKLMSCVAVEIEGRQEPMCLTTKALVDNHVTSWETLAKIEMEMLKRNCSFFRDGRALTFFDGIAQLMKSLTIETLTASLPSLLKAAKQPSENSEQSTA